KIAHLKISTQGLPVGVKIGGMDFTINLPAGITLSKDAVTNQVSPGAVIIAGVAAATGSTSISLATLDVQTLRTVLANAQGFGAGEFVDISCTIPAGVTVTADSFTAPISAATPVVSDLSA